MSTSFDYASKTLLIFSGTSSGVSHCLFTTVICTLIGIASVRIGLTFLSEWDCKHVFENNEIDIK